MPKRSGKRKRTYKRSVDRKQNKEIKKLKSSVAKLVSVKERKFYDFQVDSAVGATVSGINVNLTGIPAYQPSVTAHSMIQQRRERNSCLMTSMTIKGLVSIPYGQGITRDYENMVRILLVRSNDDNGNPITYDQVLQDPGDLATSFYAIDNSGGRKYDVMYDRTFFLQNNHQRDEDSTPVEPWRKKFTIRAKIPKRGLKLEWPNSNISGNPVKNGMYLIALSDSAAISHPRVQLYGRIRFIDE